MYHRICILAVETITYAMKAQTVLNNARIAATVIHLLPHQTKEGCAYGLQLSCNDAKTALRLVEAEGIRAKLINGR